MKANRAFIAWNPGGEVRIMPLMEPENNWMAAYAFRLNTGPLGANFFVKEHIVLDEWNLFFASQSEGLMSLGFREYWKRNVDALKGMGATVGIESINRVDFAMDFLTRDFELFPNQFVAPPRTKRPVEYSDWQGQEDEAKPQIITAGRSVETVTIGRMPGRQVIVYDKRAEALKKNKLHWFEQWGVDPRDPNVQVWRVELRAGKRHLKQDFGISTFKDIEDSIGDVFGKMVRDIRYLEPGQTDTNITRANLHPLWLAVRDGLGRVLGPHESGLLPGRIIEIERSKQRTRYIDNIAGNAAGLAVVDGQSFAQALETLPDALAVTLHNRFDENPAKFAEKMARAEKKYRFLNHPKPIH